MPSPACICQGDGQRLFAQAPYHAFGHMPYAGGQGVRLPLLESNICRMKAGRCALPKAGLFFYLYFQRGKKRKKWLTSGPAYAKIKYVLTRERQYADVAELADALDSGSSEGNFIWVQVPSSAPGQVPVGYLIFLFYGTLQS